MKKIYVALAFGLMLGACSSEPVRVPPLQYDYSSLGKISLNVQDVNIINRSMATMNRPPYVGQMFTPTLADAVSKWAQDRLVAAGNAGHATVIIKEASLMERPLTLSTGIDSWFTREQGSKYIGRVEVVIEAQSPVNSAVGTATANATYAVTLPEKPTEAEKTAAYHDVVNHIMDELNQKAEQAIRDHMAHFTTVGLPVRSSVAAPLPVAPVRTGAANWSDGEPEPLPPATISAPVIHPIRK